MMIYSGNVAAASQLEVVRRHKWGRMISTTHWRTPLPDLPWALDNGAFSAYRQGRSFDLRGFIKQYRRLATAMDPDFAVVPDMVGQGFRSLQFSLQHVDAMWWHVPSYLAVQDGMTVADVEPVLHFFEGIFVGGTVQTNRQGNDQNLSPREGRSAGWKWLTAGDWIDLAHRHGLKCHIGRVGTYHDVLHARSLGADSIDSTSWALHDRHDVLVDAMHAPLPKREIRLGSPAHPSRCDALDQDDELGLAICRQRPHSGEHVLEPYYPWGSAPMLARDRGPSFLDEEAWLWPHGALEGSLPRAGSQAR